MVASCQTKLSSSHHNRIKAGKEITKTKVTLVATRANHREVQDGKIRIKIKVVEEEEDMIMDISHAVVEVIIEAVVEIIGVVVATSEVVVVTTEEVGVDMAEVALGVTKDIMLRHR